MSGAQGDPAPILVIAVGNLSRGDDAVGPWIAAEVERALAARIAAGEVEVLVDHQLQVEHALDLQGRAKVVFVDAGVGMEAGFAWDPVQPATSPLAVSHALSPAELLATFTRLFGPPPPAWTLAVRGESFTLGDPPSPVAREAATAALAHLLRELA